MAIPITNMKNLINPCSNGLILPHPPDFFFISNNTQKYKIIDNTQKLIIKFDFNLFTNNLPSTTFGTFQLLVSYPKISLKFIIMTTFVRSC